MRYHSLTLLSASILATQMAYANTSEPNVVLDEMVIEVSKEAGKYVAVKPFSLKDDKQLYNTAQSISVLTPEQIEQKQASTVAELLENVAGVSSGVQGRRGWDDFIIRGQVSSAQTYVDGMRVQTSTNNLRAWDVQSAESVEVIKGPTTVGYGMNLPGGMVNITSKRPQDESFNRASVTVGNFAQKELTYDINYAPNEGSSKGAFRLNGRYADRDDATDHVYFKNYYVAPSYTFDLGDKTDLTVLGSYQWRDYIRQQGLPHNNTVNLATGEKTVRNAHENYSPKTFFGLPNYGYEQETIRAGYDFGYQLNDSVRLSSIFAVTRTELDGNPVLATATNNFWRNGTIGRQINNQLKKDTMYTMDNRAKVLFDTGALQHSATVGVDLLRERSDYYRRNEVASPAFNANAPDYTVNNVGSPTLLRQEITTTQYAGLYAKDDLTWNNITLGLSGRYDWANTQVDSLTANTLAKRSDTAFTGGASLMYDFDSRFAPYISYSTSFNQNSDTGADGNILDPEKGKQWEAGVKFQGFNRRLQGYLSYYDLTRRNVSETVYDPVTGISAGYSQLVGKQRTKGVELESALVLNNQWNISGSYSYIPTADIEEASIASNVGQRLSQIPKHAASVSTQYYLNAGRQGWYVGGGVRYQGKRTAWRTAINNSGVETTHFIDLPDYTLLDLKAGYEAKNWGLDLAVKNITDKDYLIGTTPNAQLVSYGEPRNVRATLKFKF